MSLLPLVSGFSYFGLTHEAAVEPSGGLLHCIVQISAYGWDTGS